MVGLALLYLFRILLGFILLKYFAYNFENQTQSFYLKTYHNYKLFWSIVSFGQWFIVLSVIILCTRLIVGLDLLRLGFFFVLIIWGGSGQSGHFIDYTQSGKLVQEYISPLINQIPDDLQCQQVTIIIILWRKAWTNSHLEGIVQERITTAHLYCEL